MNKQTVFTRTNEYLKKQNKGGGGGCKKQVQPVFVKKRKTKG